MSEKIVFNPKNKMQYYVFQLIGWLIFTILLGLAMSYNESVPNSFYWFLGLNLLFNLLLSHLYRYLILKINWTKGGLGIVLFKLFFSSVLLGIIFSYFTNATNVILNNGEIFKTESLINGFILGFLVYFIWSILYFVYLFFYRARRIEFKNLKMQALTNEVELRNLRSQLNPHFMFNAMNSIRALVDENPVQSKKAITQLSNILRNALVYSKSEEITIKKELAVVEDYLNLEKIRYEERLEIIKNIDSDCLELKIPPLLIQTLVENGIKHGISKLMKGGFINLTISKENKILIIRIINSGKIVENSISETGIGVKNTIKRLELKYGKKASFSLIDSKDNTVITEVKIPIENTN